MHPTLVSIVRERMRSQTTEQLLDLWVTNDRASWSPEAFEAVKQLLAERGQTELPAQSDPAPLGRRWSASDHPDAAYGMSWLRPILWICIVAGSVALAKAPALVWVFVKNSSGIPLRFYDLGRPRIFMEAVVVGILLPLWLVVASVAALRVRRWARPALLLYALVATAAIVAVAGLRLVEFRPSYGGNQWSMIILVTAAEKTVQTLVLPAVLWVLMRRAEVRGVFEHASPGSGFEPALSGETFAAWQHR